MTVWAGCPDSRSLRIGVDSCPQAKAGTAPSARDGGVAAPEAKSGGASGCTGPSCRCSMARPRQLNGPYLYAFRCVRDVVRGLLGHSLGHLSDTVDTHNRTRIEIKFGSE